MTKSPDAQDDAEHELRDNLRAAIEDNQLTVQFLPKLSVRSGRLVGVEALARWEHPQHGQSRDRALPAPRRRRPV